MRCKSTIFAILALAAVAHAQEASGPVDIPVNIGQSVKDIRVPHFNAQGKLILRLNAAQAERASTDQFNFDGLRIEIFDANPDKPELEVLLGEAVFDRTTNLLTGKSTSTIKGDNVQITGRQLQFDVKTRLSRLQGPVTMVVTGTEKFKQ